MKVRLKNEVLADRIARSNRSLNGWAQNLKIGSGHLSQLVNGKRPYPTPETREKLMKGLGLGFDDLFEVHVPHEATGTS